MMIFRLLFLLLLVLCFSSPGGKAVESRPNIVLLFVDDMGWNDLGFRNSTFESPHIDRLAATSVSYERAYIASPTCSPSRGTLYTGKHPVRLELVRHIPGGPQHGFDKFGRASREYNYWKGDPAQFPCINWLPLEHVTYAEALKSMGYKNHFIGKWHLGHEPYHPIHQGFDTQYGTSNFGHPPSYYPPYFYHSDVLKEQKDAYLTDVLTDQAVKIVEGSKADEPFMLTFSYYNVHSPHQGRKDYVEHFKKRGLDGKQAEYAAMVKVLDESVGRVLKAIKDKGIEQNTVVMFLSDQGGYFSNAPLRGGKMGGLALYEGGARVPFFVRWPGLSPRKSMSVVQSTDLFPTLVEMAGGKPEDYQNLDGVSLLENIKADKKLQRKAIYAYRAYEDLYVSVRSGAWKLMAFRSGKLELYNIDEDPSEKNNRVEELPEKVSEMVSILRTWEKKMGVQKYSGVQ